MKKRNLSPEQQRQREEKKARIALFVRRIAQMSDEERAEFSAKIPVVVTCEGHPLTPRNTMLLYFQNTNGTPITIVGGFRQWIKQGRCVRKGEKGMTIFVPCGGSKRDADEQSEGDRTFFVGGTVFDISQTDELTDANDENPAPAEWQPGWENATPACAHGPGPLSDCETCSQEQLTDRAPGEPATIWNSDGTGEPALICPPPRSLMNKPPPGGWKESDKVPRTAVADLAKQEAKELVFELVQD